MDTSGTARAVVSSFRKLGVDFDDDEVLLFLKRTVLILTPQDATSYLIHAFINLNQLFSNFKIKLVRNPEDQSKQMGVPEEHLKGHAFHTYSLKSPDGM